MRFGLTSCAATIAVAAMMLSGCAGNGDTRPGPAVVSPQASASPTRQAPADPGPPPPPEALTDVMYRLADPAVPGADKLPLVQNSAPTDAATLDRFAAALHAGGFSPATFAATDVHWADDQPGDPPGPMLATVLATITVTTTNPTNPGPFSFPMVFHAGPAGWQLTRQTAEMLLAFDNSPPARPGR